MWAWLGISVLFLIGEMLTGTFYLLLFALGFATAGAIAWLGFDLPWQIASICVLPAVGWFILHVRKPGKKNEPNASRNANVNMDIGQTVQVTRWEPNNTARVAYRGSAWNVRLAEDATAHPGMYRIVEIDGSILVLEPEISDSTLPHS